MKEWQQRVLDGRSDRLEMFLFSGGCSNVGESERRLLHRQHIAMLEYSDILGKRIDGWD